MYTVNFEYVVANINSRNDYDYLGFKINNTELVLDQNLNFHMF